MNGLETTNMAKITNIKKYKVYGSIFLGTDQSLFCRKFSACMCQPAMNLETRVCRGGGEG